MKDYRHILPAQMTGSQAFGLFLQRLRGTGTVLPASDADIAAMIARALDDHMRHVEDNCPECGGLGCEECDETGDDPNGTPLSDTCDTLARDMEVIAEALNDDEEN